MATSGSVSKGVFVFKGRKTAANIEDYLDGGIVVGNEEERLSLCDDLWETIHQRIQVLQSDVNTKLFDDLLGFVRNAHAGFTIGRSGKSGSGVLSEVPTAALITGVNTPDHALMFSNLVALLEECVTPHVAVLRSKDCMNLRTLMAKALGQLMQNTELLEEEAEGEDIGPVKLRGVSCTMPVLASWYAHISKRSSPKKRKSVEGMIYPPIIIVLEDLEGFPASVLQDFVTICSNHLHELPLVLVLGIATAMTAVHRLLPHTVSSQLCMEKFQAPFSTDYLTQVINKVVLTADIPFKLGAKVFNLLLDLFLFHDFSVLNFITTLQFCMLDHFYSNPASVLCQPTEEVVHHLKSMSHDQLEQIRRNMSFRKFVENQPPEEQIALLEDDKYTKKKMAKFLANLESYHESFYPVLRCLHMLTCKLPKYPLGKQIRELYATCLTTNVFDTSEYMDAMGLLRALSRTELVEMLSRCVESFSEYDITGDVAVELQKLKNKFDNIEDLAKFHGDDDDDDGSDEQTEPDGLLPKKMDMFTLRQKLQEMDKKTKKLTVYEVLRNEVIDYLDTVFKKYLMCPQSLPLYEVLYYSDVATVRQHINGAPRTTIQNGLARPHYYLQNPGCQCEGAFIPSTLPDVCVAYKLHVECGRLINLYDWLQAFITVVDPQEDGKERKKPDQVMQARFIRAVSELQFLGFIKPTKRKTDHVARLTWGGC